MRVLFLFLVSLSLALAGCSKAPPPGTSTTSTTSTTPPTGGTTGGTNSTGGSTNSTTPAPAPKDLCSDTKDFSTQQPDPATPGSFVATTKACPGVTAGYTAIML